MAMALKDKAVVVGRLLEAKAKSGKTFTQIAKETGLTNAYVGQLFHRQAQLIPTSISTQTKLKKAVPALKDDGLIEDMMVPVQRSFDPSFLQDPVFYRFYEATMHYGQTFKAIMQEELGDGIMSAVNFHCKVETVKGKEGEDRVLITLNGRFLPFNEQKEEDR
ncbi:hypothetical protein O6H91_04G046200 [Diphasiastrum complanatum]|uniref:Uncharacterized protein n=1 Tax=Diphasiastrum complanatum TaxID=34168 RepID=A0ACC2DWL0_DIPCM|nr:hypothetical protein O6H91_04G046200 [Diphasiastrum complanatum]